MRKFVNRTQAGRMLAEELDTATINYDLVLALPRGGVPVGVEVATALGIPLNIYVARKLGVPNKDELGMGAIAEPNILILDPVTVEQMGVTDEQIKEVIDQEEREVKRRISIYRKDNPLPSIKGLNILVIDDGVATGVTASAAIAGIREHEPATITLAAPVFSQSSIESLSNTTDDVVCLIKPPFMESIGQFYEDFGQVTDDDVIQLLLSLKAV